MNTARRRRKQVAALSAEGLSVVEIAKRIRRRPRDVFEDIKRLAYTEYNRALREGRLVRPDHCSGCGGGGRIHGHHEDYARPLDVEWLCPSCHGARHAGPTRWPRVVSVPPQPFLRPDDVAEQYGVAVERVKAWAKAGCPHRRLSSHTVRFLADEVAAWLEAGRPSAAS